MRTSVPLHRLYGETLVKIADECEHQAEICQRFYQTDHPMPLREDPRRWADAATYWLNEAAEFQAISDAARKTLESRRSFIPKAKGETAP